jgi:hypothetical protein
LRVLLEDCRAVCAAAYRVYDTDNALEEENSDFGVGSFYAGA